MRMLPFRIPTMLVKCLSLQPCFVTTSTRSSGVTILLSLEIDFSLSPGANTMTTNTNTLFIRQGLRGDHWVLYNYIKARKEFQVFIFSLIIHSIVFNHQYSNDPNDPKSLSKCLVQ